MSTTPAPTLKISPERAAALIQDSYDFGKAMLKHHRLLLEFFGDPLSDADCFANRLIAASPELASELMPVLRDWAARSNKLLTVHIDILRVNLEA